MEAPESPSSSSQSDDNSESEMSDILPLHTGSKPTRTQTPTQARKTDSIGNKRLFSENSDPRSDNFDPLTDVTNCEKRSRKRTNSSSATDMQLKILEELEKANRSISDLSQTFSTRLDAVEKRLESVEQQSISTPASSTDQGNSAEKAKRKVPTRVRVSS